eukprot:gb/GECH01013790.1/.p1 GENE.gb/GECH01013790.1/~~gb/GECH01013790.1/.p1  ORF type:complete len:246 (+),score=60.28 gb/GECH01013790.1/:1-738(+)
MKFLSCPSLTHYNSILDRRDIGDSILCGKIEAYSCKPTHDDKKLSKNLEQKLLNELFHNAQNEEDLLSKSPTSPIAESPFGPLSLSSSRKTLIHLIATLNASYTDYDFSTLKPEDFVKESNPGMIFNSISMSLNNVLSNEDIGGLWKAIDEIIPLGDCDIYSYLPDPDTDPMSEGNTIWSWNYFFYSRKHKKVIFFTCRAISNRFDGMDETFDDMDDDDYSTNKNYGVHYRSPYNDEDFDFDDLY